MARSVNTEQGLKVALVYDQRDYYIAKGLSMEQVAEFDSPATLEAISHTIQSLGHQVELIGNGQQLAERLVMGQRWDLIFNIAEGIGGRSREAQVPALLEMYGQRYTFSDPLVCALTLDKAMTKRILISEGLPTPRFCLVESMADIESLDLELPVFAKPVAEGTGKGIDRRSRVESRKDLTSLCEGLLDQYKQPVLVEEYLPGREFTTGILGTGSEAYVLGSLEIRIRPDAPSRDYGLEVKEACERFVEYLPVPDDPIRTRIEQLALKTHRLLGCRDASRVDIRLDNSGQPAILEINPLPGLHPTHSDLPMIATQAGLTYDQLIARIVDSAMHRPNMLCPALS